MWVYIIVLSIAAASAAWLIWWTTAKNTPQPSAQSVTQVSDEPIVEQPPATEPPQISTEVVVSGRDHVWDLGFLPDGTMLFTERKGAVSIVAAGAVKELAKISDVQARGEGGLLGLAIDPKFSDNRFIYTCQNTTHGDIRVSRWKLNDAVTSMGERKDIIVGIPQNSSGRHSGCRVAFGPDDVLWVGTGDAALNDSIPQSATSLGGKILRVDRDGNAASGNLPGPFDSRIFSYGHRNVQGLAFFAKPVSGVVGISVEHGSYEDDEVNALTPGNFGWSPRGPGYIELGVPMTDKGRFPDAIGSMWRSGNPTIAPSGATFLTGKEWRAWEGRLAMVMLKGAELQVLRFDSKNAFVESDVLFNDQFGRLRASVMGPNNVLYITTDNGDNDKIIRVIPK